MAQVTLENIVKSYGDGSKIVPVLKGVNFSLEKGETVAIVGASGVGKSTLLNIIGSLDRPTEGSVTFNGETLFSKNFFKSDLELSEFRNKNIGFVFQSHHLLTDFTAIENVMMPTLISGASVDDARELAEGFLSTVGLSERLNHKPGELSGGEQQRVAIVRALAQSPELVLADEPTGNLDSKTGEIVFELLLELNKEKSITLVVVTHNDDLARRLDRRVKMVDGKLYDL